MMAVRRWRPSCVLCKSWEQVSLRTSPSADHLNGEPLRHGQRVNEHSVGNTTGLGTQEPGCIACKFRVESVVEGPTNRYKMLKFISACGRGQRDGHRRGTATASQPVLSDCQHRHMHFPQTAFPITLNKHRTNLPLGTELRPELSDRAAAARVRCRRHRRLPAALRLASSDGEARDSSWSERSDPIQKGRD